MPRLTYTDDDVAYVRRMASTLELYYNKPYAPAAGNIHQYVALCDDDVQDLVANVLDSTRPLRLRMKWVAREWRWCEEARQTWCLRRARQRVYSL